MPPAPDPADAALVAAELAELAHYTGQQARAEARLLGMLPVADAARILRDEVLARLAGEAALPWGRYLQLEKAIWNLRGEPSHQQQRWPSLWHELAVGDEPEPLQHLRRRLRIGWQWTNLGVDLR